MRIHPGGFRLVLVGAKISRLLPFLQARGFLAEAFLKGGEAQARLRVAPCHVLIVELEVGDMMGVELGRAARQDRHAGAVVLMDDPSRSGMIVAALSRGLETFLPIPPDENVFLERLETLLLAQWGLVVTQQQAQLMEDLNRAKEATVSADERALKAEAKLDEAQKKADAQVAEARKKADEARKSVDDAVREARAALQAELAEERRKVDQLKRETSVLRDQLTSMHLVTGAKSGVSEEGLPVLPVTPDAPAAATPAAAATARAATTQTTSKAAPATTAVGGPGRHLNTERERPAPTTGLDDLDDYATQTLALPGRQSSPVLIPPKNPPPKNPSPGAVGFADPPRKTMSTPGVGSLASTSGGASTTRAPAPVSGTGTPVPSTTKAGQPKPATAKPAASATPAPTTGRPPPSGGRAAGVDDDSAEAELPTLKGPRPAARVGGGQTLPEESPKTAGAELDFDFPTTQVVTSGGVRAPASVFDDPTPLLGIKDLGQSSSFHANDERTAPGGHSISAIQSEIAAAEKQAVRAKEAARAAGGRNVDAGSLRDIAELPSLDEEVLFLEDD